MRKLIYLLPLLILFSACSGSRQSDQNGYPSGIEFDSIVIVEKALLFPEKADKEPYMEVDISITYPSHYKDRQVLSRLQELFFKPVFGNQYTADLQQTVDEMVAGMVKEYREEVPEIFLSLKEDYPDLDNSDSRFMHDYRQKTQIEFVNENLLSYSDFTYRFSGLMHGMGEKNYRSIDLNTMRFLEERDIFKPGYESALSCIIYRHLLNEIAGQYDPELLIFGDFPSSAEVKPNGNFCMDEKGLHYNYHEYEVFLPVSTMCPVFIPYSEIKSLLNIDVLKQYFGEEFEIEDAEMPEVVDWKGAPELEFFADLIGYLPIYSTYTPVDFAMYSDRSLSSGMIATIDEGEYWKVIVLKPEQDSNGNIWYYCYYPDRDISGWTNKISEEDFLYHQDNQTIFRHNYTLATLELGTNPKDAHRLLGEPLIEKTAIGPLISEGEIYNDILVEATGLYYDGIRLLYKNGVLTNAVIEKPGVSFGGITCGKKGHGKTHVMNVFNLSARDLDYGSDDGKQFNFFGTDMETLSITLDNNGLINRIAYEWHN